MAYINGNLFSSTILVGTPDADTLDEQFADQATTLIGGLGNDTYIIDHEADPLTQDDTIVEEAGGGIDTVRSYATYALAANVENLVLLGTAHTGTGNELDNSITGNFFDNVIDGGAGKDIMAGGAGSDTYYVDNTLDVVTEALNEGLDTVNSTATWVMSANIEILNLLGFANINGTGNAAGNAIVGNDGKNVIDGGSGNDELYGHGGDDTLIGGAGNDLLNGGAGADTMIGGTGDDYYYVDSEDKPVVEAAGGGNDTVETTATWRLEANVENLILAVGASGHLLGNSLNNYLQGNELGNIMSAGAGNDTLDGRAGADYMTGGSGNDTYVVDNANDVVFELAGAAEGSTDKIITSVFYQLPDNVENIQLAGTGNLTAYGNSLDNVMTGNDGNNFLLAFGGNDTLIGGAGADNMQGGAGNDVYYFDNTGDFALEFNNSGTDTVFTSVGYNFGGSFYIENMTLTGTGDLSVTGNNLNNVITGNSGANFIDGRDGFDTMSGGLGNDTYIVGNFVAGNATLSDSVVEAANAGYDAVMAYASYVMPANVERLVLGNTAGNINGTGNSLDNTIEGNGGNNVIDGGAGNDSIFAFGGNDTLIGGLGNDTLNGGTGNDTMSGGLGDDLYVVSDAGDIVIENASSGTDTVRTSVAFDLSVKGVNVENLTLNGDANINGTGNALNNILTGNNGNNTLSGGAGNDFIDGGTGADAMSGGTGNDTYVVDQWDFNDPSLNDTVSEAPTEGIDTVQVSVSRGDFDLNTQTNALVALEANVENLVMLGTDDLQAKGNGLANIMTGNSGNNALDGGGGADKLIGGKGDDIYFVDLSTDVITELAGEGTDQVFVQFVPTGPGGYVLGATLEILRFSLQPGVANLNGTGNALDNGMEGNDLANRLDGGTGNDLLVGGGGGDILIGGAGNDFLEGDGGHATLTGGTGNDWYVIGSVSGSDHSPDATIVELAGQGTDTVRTEVDFDMSNPASGAANIENLYLADGNYFNDNTGAVEPNWNIHAVGNALDNQIFGNLSNNVVEGAGGNDTFYFYTYEVDNSDWAAIRGTPDPYFGATLDSNDSVWGGIQSGVDSGTDALFASIIDLNSGLPLHVHGVENITLYSGSYIGGANAVNASDISGADRITISDIRPEDYGYDQNGDPVWSVADMTLTNLAPGIEIKASGYNGALSLSLADSGGAADEQLVTLNGFHGTLTTSGIEKVILNVDQLPDGSDDTAGMHDATGVSELVLTGRSGVLNLTLPAGADLMFENMNLRVQIFDMGLTSLSIGLDNSGATLITASTLTNLNLDTTGSGGASFLDVSGSGAQLVNATGDQDLSMTVAQNLDAHAMTGNLYAGAWGLGYGVSLEAGLGSDTLNGGGSDDRLNGGSAGNDILYGNDGADTFVFDSGLGVAGHNVYTPDFTSGTDHIELNKAVFTNLGAPGTLDAGDFYKGDVGGLNGQHIAYEGNTGNLYYSSDGTAASAQLIANTWYNPVENTDINIV
jgi:trimeric autotransporter adhesin